MTETTPSEPTTIAFYLPQFHQIPENDEWWGEGFTEWTNVRAAKPLFAGHAQPREPGELGYYDLLDEHSREAQASLAKEYGVDAFCYWHYWFGDGRRILEQPLDEVLRTGRPDLPFAVCWANTSWTGVWHGTPNRTLMEQRYPGDDDYAAFFDSLLPLFRDPRYLRVDEKPLFLVFAPNELPDAAHFVAVFTELAERADLPGLHMLAMTSDVTLPSLRAFDGVVLNAPGNFLATRKPNRAKRAVMRIAAHPRARVLPRRLRRAFGAPRVFDFADVVAAASRHPEIEMPLYPCVLPGWDNTPRSKRRGLVFENGSPALFGQYMRNALRQARAEASAHPLVFIKAWNEWAEGNVLEPDREHGRAYLEALRTALRADAESAAVDGHRDMERASSRP